MAVHGTVQGGSATRLPSIRPFANLPRTKPCAPGEGSAGLPFVPAEETDEPRPLALDSALHAAAPRRGARIQPLSTGAFELDWATLEPWVLPFAFVVGGALVGILFEKLVVRRLDRATRRTVWEWDDVVMRSLKRAPVLLFTAAGAWAATQFLPLTGPVESFLENALMVLVILSVTMIASRAAAEWISRYATRQGTALPASSLVTNIARLVVFVLGILLILANLGINITALVTGLGIGGLAVALALQPTLANAFAGFQIIATRQVRDGDYVRLESGEEGYVVDIRWRNTTIKALYDDYEIIVPNSKLSDSILFNYNLPARPYWVRVEVGVGYASDLERVEQVTLEVATEVWKEYTRAHKGDEPVLRFREFADSAITLSVRVLADRFAHQYRIRHELVKRLQRRYEEEGIVIPWPIRTLHVPESARFRVEQSGDLPEGREPPHPSEAIPRTEV